jgi:hypothetical protein
MCHFEIERGTFHCACPTDKVRPDWEPFISAIHKGEEGLGRLVSIQTHCQQFIAIIG